jgi:hypothetical protein
MVSYVRVDVARYSLVVGLSFRTGRDNGREQGLTVPAIAHLIFLAKSDAIQVPGFGKPRIKNSFPKLVVMINQSPGRLHYSRIISRRGALVCVPHQINVERWNEHRLRIEPEEF